MNRHVRWRIDFARTLRSRLDHFADMEAMLVIGSVARGYSDVYSDLELMLVWSHQPDLDQQSTVMQSLQAEFRYPAMDLGYQSSVRIQGIPVDLWHTTAAQEDVFIQAVLHDYSLDLVANNRLDTLRSAIPLRGTDRVQQWKTIVQVYPEELAIRFLETYISHFHLRQLNLAAYRGNPTTFYHILSNIQCSLFLILLAVNHAYFPTFKWMYPALRSLPIGPEQVAARLQHMFQEPPIQAIAHLREVLSETLVIVEARYPQLDTAYARYGLDQAPQVYETSPTPADDHSS